MSEITIERRFCGPANSGNGGYVSGVMARNIEGIATAVLRAIIPLDTALEFDGDGTRSTLSDQQGALIAEGRAADGANLPTPPTPPNFEQATAAAGRYFAFTKSFHPVCFTCGPERNEGDGLRVFVGQIEDAPKGHVAGVWTPHQADLADADGFIRTEIVWAAMDCPGSIAWVEHLGSGGGLLGTMTGEVLRRPKLNEACIITAWPIEREGRKQIAGVALFSAEGELMARGHQIWISRAPRAEPA